MKELQECLTTKKKIDKLDARIYELRSAVLAPKNQIITDMPKSRGGVGNPIEKYLLRLERLQARKDILLAYQREQWEKAQRKAQMTKQESYLLYLRVISGLPWKKCVALTNKRYPSMNENKAFRIYRRINEIF